MQTEPVLGEVSRQHSVYFTPCPDRKSSSKYLSHSISPARCVIGLFSFASGYTELAYWSVSPADVDGADYLLFLDTRLFLSTLFRSFANR